MTTLNYLVKVETRFGVAEVPYIEHLLTVDGYRNSQRIKLLAFDESLKTLHFHVEFSLDSHNEDTLKHIQKSMLFPTECVGRTSVHYQEWLTKPDSYFETIEKTAWQSGETDI